MKKLALLAVVLHLTYIVSSVPVSETSTTPAPDTDCVAECDLEKLECGMDCRAVKPQTRQGFLNCSKDCKAEYRACFKECLDEAVEQVEEAKQDALEAASEATTKSPGGEGQSVSQEGQGNAVANKDEQENKSTSGGTQETSAGQRKANKPEKVDIVVNELANIGTENAGILSSAIGGATKEEGVAVHHDTGNGAANSTANANKADEAGATATNSNNAADESSGKGTGEENENAENETTNNSNQGNSGFTENAEAGWDYDPFDDELYYGSYEYDEYDDYYSEENDSKEED